MKKVFIILILILLISCFTEVKDNKSIVIVGIVSPSGDKNYTYRLRVIEDRFKMNFDFFIYTNKTYSVGDTIMLCTLNKNEIINEK